MQNGKITILHVEDNFENLVLIRRLLQFQGYEVLEADSVAKAVSILKVQKPDLNFNGCESSTDRWGHSHVQT